MNTKVQVVFYSMYGHVYRMAEAVAEGARSLPGVDVVLRQVPETLPDDVIAKMGAAEARKAFAHVPVADTADLFPGKIEKLWTIKQLGAQLGKGTAAKNKGKDLTGWKAVDNALFGSKGAITEIYNAGGKQ